jgi:hypothetical protein
MDPTWAMAVLPPNKIAAMIARSKRSIKASCVRHQNCVCGVRIANRPTSISG